MTERKTIYNRHTSPHTPRMHLRCIGGQGCVCMMLKGRLLGPRRPVAGILRPLAEALVGFYGNGRGQKRTATAPQSAPPDAAILPLGGVSAGCSGPCTTTSTLAVADDPPSRGPAPQAAATTPDASQDALGERGPPEGCQESSAGVGAPETVSSVPLPSASENVGGTQDTEAEAEAPPATEAVPAEPATPPEAPRHGDRRKSGNPLDRLCRGGTMTTERGRWWQARR